MTKTEFIELLKSNDISHNIVHFENSVADGYYVLKNYHTYEVFYRERGKDYEIVGFPSESDALEYLLGKLGVDSRYMKKQFEAYYSEYWAWFWFFLSIIFCVNVAIFSVWWLETISVTFIIVFSICAIIFFLMFVKTKRETGIAVEIIDNILILHKKEIISIPIKDIQRIDVHNADGSFDILVKTADKKYSMHCFIKEQRQKKVLFIDYLKNNNIKLKTFDLL